MVERVDMMEVRVYIVPVQEEVKEMVERVDMDGSGSIEFLEFLLLMGKILQDTPSTDDLRSIFTGQHFLIY